MEYIGIFEPQSTLSIRDGHWVLTGVVCFQQVPDKLIYVAMVRDSESNRLVSYVFLYEPCFWFSFFRRTIEGKVEDRKHDTMNIILQHTLIASADGTFHLRSGRRGKASNDQVKKVATDHLLELRTKVVMAEALRDKSLLPDSIPEELLDSSFPAGPIYRFIGLDVDEFGEEDSKKLSKFISSKWPSAGYIPASALRMIERGLSKEAETLQYIQMFQFFNFVGVRFAFHLKRDPNWKLVQEKADLIAAEGLDFTQRCFIKLEYVKGPTKDSFLRIVHLLVDRLSECITLFDQSVTFMSSGLRYNPEALNTTPRKLIKAFKNADVHEATDVIDQIFAYIIGELSKTVKGDCIDKLVMLRDFLEQVLAKHREEVLPVWSSL